MLLPKINAFPKLNKFCKIFLHFTNIYRSTLYILKLSADLRKKDCKKMTENLCQRLQLDINRKVEELSFGNRKKVAIVKKTYPSIYLFSITDTIKFMQCCTAMNGYPFCIRFRKHLYTITGNYVSLSDNSSTCTISLNFRKHMTSVGDISDLSISEPDLEEVFMHYYEKDGDKYDTDKT